MPHYAVNVKVQEIKNTVHQSLRRKRYSLLSVDNVQRVSLV